MIKKNFNVNHYDSDNPYKSAYNIRFYCNMHIL